MDLAAAAVDAFCRRSADATSLDLPRVERAERFDPEGVEGAEGASVPWRLPTLPRPPPAGAASGGAK